MQTKFCRPVRLKTCQYHEDEQIVQSGLAVTPRQMMELTQRGVPISPSNLGLVYEEGVSKLDFEPPMEYRRGVDMADMWEHRQDMRKKVSSPEFQNLLKGGEE